MTRFSFLNRIPLAPVIGGMFALVAAILLIATPHWLFQQAVAESGLPSILPAAAPPLGVKARILATLAAMAIAGGVVWALVKAAERVLERRSNAASSGAEADKDETEGRTLDRILADRRRPIFAEADLGAPLMSDEAAAVAREELVLDTALPDEEAQVAGPDGGSTETISPETDPAAMESSLVLSVDAIQDDARVAPLPSLARDADEEKAESESVADLMSRLETALDRREKRLGRNAPMPGDISALRAALGLRAGS
jgi:hypothetical protein